MKILLEEILKWKELVCVLRSEMSKELGAES